MSIYQAHFYKSNSAYLLFADNALVSANGAACDFLSIPQKALIGLKVDVLFPSLPTSQNAVIQTIMLPNGESHSVVFRKFELSDREFSVRIRQPLINDDEMTDQELIRDTKTFRSMIVNLNDITLTLSNCEDLDSLYREAVLLGKSKLGLERLAILLIDADKTEQFGTFGTDVNGELTDERHWRAPMNKTPWITQALKEPRFFYFWEDIDLLMWGEVVGSGWSGMANLWDSDGVFGWLASDNLISHKKLTPSLQEIFRLYALNLSQLIVRKKAELNLKDANANLEQRVAKKTQDLNDRLVELEQIQKQLVEQEKLASLGNMVAGMAHEINTPLGNAQMSLSQINHSVKEVFEATSQGKLTKQTLSLNIEDISQASTLLETNLNRSVEMVQSFKQFAAEHTPGVLAYINLHDLVEHVINGRRTDANIKKIQCNNTIDSELRFYSLPKSIAKIVTAFLDNGLLHAFANNQEGKINFIADKKDGILSLIYEDNGIGLKDGQVDRIFEPFYTSTRGSGSMGLGLSLVYQLIRRELKGTLLYEPVVPHGVRLIVTFPVKV